MKTPKQEKKSLLKNAAWLFTGGMGSSVFAMLEVVVLTRFLGLELFGLFSIVIAFVNITQRFLDFNVKEAAVKYIGQYRERGDKDKTTSFIKLFYLIDLILGAVAFVAVILLTDIANSYFIKADNANELVLIYALGLLVSTVNTTSRAILETLGKFKDVAFAGMFGTFTRFVFVLAFLLVGLGVKGALAGYIVAAFIRFLILQFLVYRTLKKEGFNGWLRANVNSVSGEIREVGLFIAGSTTSRFLNNVFSRNFPVLLLGYFFTSEASGLYKVATAFSKVTRKVKGPASSAIYPALVTLKEQQSYRAFKQLISYSVRFMLKLFVPAGIAVFVFADDIINLLFGSQYVSAANAMRIIVVSDMLSGLTFWITPVYLAFGKIKMRVIISFVGVLLYSVALIYLVPLYSFQGAALAKIAPYPITLFAAFFLYETVKRRSNRQKS